MSVLKVIKDSKAKPDRRVQQDFREVLVNKAQPVVPEKQTFHTILTPQELMIQIT